jgi:type II secretory pathway component PulJ
MDSLTIVTALLSMLVGGAITWLVSRSYYLRASEDLTKEANNLRHLTELMLRGMEAAGWVKYNRNAEGKPVGIIFEDSGGAIGHLSASGADIMSQIPIKKKEE